MANFNYSEFAEAINDQMLYLDFEEAIEDVLQPTIDGTFSDEDYLDYFKMVEEEFCIDCVHMANDPKCREIIKEACQKQIDRLREMYN